MENQNKIYSVSELNLLLKAVIEGNKLFSLMLVSGEIVGYKKHSSGHLYFSLKDNSDRVKCVMFSRQSRYLSFRPQDGMKVLVQGRLSVYTRSGEYQLYVDSIHPIGVGDLHFRFIELKDKMNKLGYFDKNLKRDIPKIPGKIGIITSSTGAAIHDILKTVKSKYPPVKIIIAPASVQGENSAPELVASIQLLNRVTDLDTIIISRGGGAAEELWSFNDESVIRAIRQSQVPVISAVGHEIDTTLSDLAADKVAATPTAAGELVVPDINDLYRDVDLLYDRMTKAIENKLNYMKNTVEIMSQKINLYHPANKLQQQNRHVEFLHDSLKIRFELNYTRIKDRFKSLEKRIMELHPKDKLANGYALVYNDTNSLISSIMEVKLNDHITIEFYNGKVKAEVLKKEVKNDER